jgi:hypothetical protein
MQLIGHGEITTKYNNAISTNSNTNIRHHFQWWEAGVFRQLWQDNQCQPLVSRLTVTKLIQVLAYTKFNDKYLVEPLLRQ